VPVLVLLAGGCTDGAGGHSRPPGCESFDRIAVTIEAEGPSADVGGELRAIQREAQAGGDEAVADAATALLAARGGDPNRWYLALAELEAACRGQR
jgi:hypothetical protein